MAELQAETHELNTRERRMTQLVQAQEVHIDHLSSHKVPCCTLQPELLALKTLSDPRCNLVSLLKRPDSALLLRLVTRWR